MGIQRSRERPDVPAARVRFGGDIQLAHIQAGIRWIPGRRSGVHLYRVRPIVRDARSGAFQAF